MAITRKIERAQLRPGKCLFSGDSKGPFIDTGVDIDGYGRVYLSIRHLEGMLRPYGFRSGPEVVEMLEKLGTVTQQNTELRKFKDGWEEAVETIRPFMPEVPPEIVVHTQIQYEEPDDEQIELWLKRNPDHPLVVQYRPYDAGSSEEWQALYAGHNEKKRAKAAKERAREEWEKQNKLRAEIEAVTEDDGPPRFIELMGQQVDLDMVLQADVQSILTMAGDMPAEFHGPLLEREKYLAKKGGTEPRKTLVKGLLKDVEKPKITLKEA